MRKMIGLVALGLGAFLLVSAPLLRLYVYPQLAKTPLDTFTQNVAEGHGMSAFYTSDLETKNNLDLFSVRRVRADIDASKALGDNMAILESHVASSDSSGHLLSSTLQHVAMDRTTGAAVSQAKCDCETWAADTDKVEDRHALDYVGQVFKMPINTQKKTYKWWDQNLEEAVDAKYLRTEKKFGTTAYVFQMRIDPTTIKTEDVPASIIGGTETGNVQVDRVYSNTRTLWIEPNTGAVIDGREELNTHFERDGQDVLTLQKGTIEYDNATQTRNAKDYKKDGGRLKLIRVTLPIAFAVIGLLSLALGFILTQGTRATGATGPARTRETSRR